MYAESPLRSIDTLVEGWDDAQKKCESDKRSTQSNGMGNKRQKPTIYEFM
jgi:hypothetical protein